jgi:Mn-containing catalase
MLQEQLGGTEGELKQQCNTFPRFCIKDPRKSNFILSGYSCRRIKPNGTGGHHHDPVKGHLPGCNNATIVAIEAHVLTGLTPQSSNLRAKVLRTYVNQTGIWPADRLSRYRSRTPAKVVYENLYRKSTTKVREKPLFSADSRGSTNTKFREASTRIQIPAPFSIGE